MSKRLIAGIGLLLLTTGCHHFYGGGFAADLPRPRALPTITSSDGRDPAANGVMIPLRHPPDAAVMAREPDPRWVTRFGSALARTNLPGPVGWSFLYVGLIAF